jgi:ABC-type phosphate transport system substrate-binding protein
MVWAMSPRTKRLSPWPWARGPYVGPSIETVRDESYPIARGLYIYTAGEPQGAVQTYLAWIMSAEGQEIVRASWAFVPLRIGQELVLGSSK